MGNRPWEKININPMDLDWRNVAKAMINEIGL